MAYGSSFESNRPGGHGNYDMWVTRRATKDDNWGPAVKCGSPINTVLDDFVPGFLRMEDSSTSLHEPSRGLGGYESMGGPRSSQS